VRDQLGVALASWQEGDGPLYRRLARALRAAIAEGAVPAGGRLPTERALAARLHVSRSTVVAAYDELEEGGWVHRRQGSGTWVRRRSPARAFGKDLPGALGRTSASFRALIEGPGDAIEFTVAAVPAPELLELEGVAEDALKELQRATLDPGYVTAGYPPLRSALAEHLSAWGLPTTDREVIVTTGAQQGIALVLELYVRRGDVVLVEDPTYLTTLDKLEAAGARVAPVPVGPDGVRADDVRAAAVEHEPCLAYLIPTFHNPTGTLVPESERRAIATVAAELQLPLVDDVTLADVPLAAPPPPPLAAFVPDAPILTVGSLSKLFWGGLRVGFVRGPEPVIRRLARLKLLEDHGSSVASQTLALALLARADEQRSRRTALARERCAHLSALLARHLPEWRWREPAGGLCMWVRLPGADATAFAEVAARYGVTVVPGPMCSPTRAFGEYLRLPFVLPPDVLDEGVGRLAAAWDAYRSRTDDERSRRLHVVV
jgi:DNA-binding transcriptional MocR family regulator